MPRTALLAAILGLLSLTTACSASPGQATGTGGGPGNEVVVFAAASLSEPFTEMAGALAKGGNARPTYNFGGSNQLRAQIEQGARVDVFASANEKEMDTLSRGGLVSDAPQVFARNRLVVITPRDNPGKIESLMDLARSGLRLVFAGPDVPVGAYTVQMLDKIGASQSYEPDFKGRVLQNVISRETDVKQVVAKIQLGEGDAGVVYSSDVTPKVAPDVRTIQIPDQFNAVVDGFFQAPHPVPGT